MHIGCTLMSGGRFRRQTLRGIRLEALLRFGSSLLSLCSEGLATAACLAGDHPKCKVKKC